MSDSRVEPPEVELERLRRRVLELEVEVSRQRDLQRIVEQIPTQIAVFDPELRYVYLNPAAVGDDSMRRWLIGKTDHDDCRRRGLDPSLADERNASRRQAIEEKRTVAHEETILGADGLPRHLLRVHTPIFDASGRFRRLLGYATDVTEMKMLESDLQQAQKLQAIGQLAAGIAHDFNNLLTAINGFAELLCHTLPADSTQHLHASEIQKAGRQAADLTRQLLAFSRRQVRETNDLDLGELVRDLAVMLERTLGETIDLRLEIADTDLVVHGDPVHLRQMVTNLALNARDAMPRGGPLLVAVQAVDGGPLSRPEGAVELCVCDRGIGMDAATKARAFEPFFTTKESSRGTGLGLSSVYGIVRQSGGTIKLDSTPDEGTEVRVLLPRRAPTVDTARRSDSEATPRAHGETVLVTEDEAMVLELTRACLDYLGYRVLVARSAREAEALAATERVDLLLTDIVMPRTDGPELAQRLLRQNPDLAVLFMTGYARSEALRRIGRDVPVVHKPFTTEGLGREVRRALDAVTRSRP